MKSIFEYDNYRQFLKDFYAYSKQAKKHFSFRYFSRLAGFKSGNNLKIVMDGKRNIAPHSIEQFAKALKLNKEESCFFRNLVLFNQAEKIDDKKRYAKELLRSRVYRKTFPLSESQYLYFSCWYFVLIRELVVLKDFNEDPEWIAKKINPRITPAEAKKALTELLKLGLLQRDSSGKLIQGEAFVTTADEVTSSAVAQYHRDMIGKGQESIERVPRHRRELSAVTMAISQEIASKIKEKIQNFRKEIAELALQEQTPESVYQFNLQLFSLTQEQEDQ